MTSIIKIISKGDACWSSVFFLRQQMPWLLKWNLATLTWYCLDCQLSESHQWTKQKQTNCCTGSHVPIRSCCLKNYSGTSCLFSHHWKQPWHMRGSRMVWPESDTRCWDWRICYWFGSFHGISWREQKLEQPRLLFTYIHRKQKWVFGSQFVLKQNIWTTFRKWIAQHYQRVASSQEFSIRFCWTLSPAFP